MGHQTVQATAQKQTPPLRNPGPAPHGRPIGSNKPCAPAPIKAGPHLARRQSDRIAFADTQIDPSAAIHYEPLTERSARQTRRILLALFAFDLAIVALVAWGLSQVQGL